MTDLSVTAANVVAGANATIVRGIAGATITAGQVVYLNTATGKYGLADNNSATAEARIPTGIALNGASANQPLAVQTAGNITIGAAMTAGVTYYLGESGAICPVADVATAGEYFCIIGIATTTAILKLGINYSGVVVPE